MTTGKLNIWIRDVNCELWNGWWVELEIKTCGGKDIFNIDPNMERNNREKLEQMYPDCDIEIGEEAHAHSPAFDKCISIKDKISDGPDIRINHIEVDVPPGCYVVRAWKCGGGNEVTDRRMVIVGCGDHVCVNLIVPRAHGKGGCIDNMIFPFIKHAKRIQMPDEEINMVVDKLVAAGELNKEEIIKEGEVRAEIAAKAKNEYAKRREIEAKTALKIFKGM